ncbi:MAG: DUF3737 family protein [Oscillospiraceae bacterium]|nr:DUF3737 family protein [Oscillospiraceae bacterium]
MEQNIIRNQTFDEERALYGIRGAVVENCTFAGPADGESVLKETRDIVVRDCSFSLRYPFWHVVGCEAERCTLDELTRAPIWYARDFVMRDSEVRGVKCLRECDNSTFINSKMISPEFGWRCRGVKLTDCETEGEYFLFESSDVEVERLRMKGKYSFQYMKNLHIVDSVLDTKDAFWHSENVVVENSVVKGEYLAWFSKNVTLINCKIIGTQPFCYCENLKLVGCTMEGTDLSFEYSSVEADVIGHIDSVKNPKSGRIVADSVGEIIWEGSVMETRGEVVIR